MIRLCTYFSGNFLLYVLYLWSIAILISALFDIDVTTYFLIIYSMGYIKFSEATDYWCTSLKYNFSDAPESWLITDKIQCSVEVCPSNKDDPKYNDKRLKELCDNTSLTKMLPNDSELYISNSYGSIKRRLTSNTVFDGEAVVSPDSKTVVYSSIIDNDYELFQMNVDGSGSRVRLTNTLGFEGGVSFSPNQKFIAYYASRPQTSESIQDYRDMMKYGFTGLYLTQIFVYSFEHKKEYQLSSVGRRSHSPVFLDNDKILFMSVPSENMYYAEFEIKEGGTIQTNVTSLGYVDKEIQDMSLSRDKNGDVNLAFSNMNNTCITKFVLPNVTYITTTPIPTTTPNNSNQIGAQFLMAFIVLFLSFFNFEL